jgi:sentrin-specific protease 1
MNGSGEKYLNALKQYMKDEANKQLNLGYDSKFDESEWETYSNPIELTPQQNNGKDCGVFTIMFADFITDDLPLRFDQSQIPQLRKRICAAVLQGTIDYSLPEKWQEN